jgi:hypothetical protein
VPVKRHYDYADAAFAMDEYPLRHVLLYHYLKPQNLDPHIL